MLAGSESQIISNDTIGGYSTLMRTALIALAELSNPLQTSGVVAALNIHQSLRPAAVSGGEWQTQARSAYERPPKYTHDAKM